MNEFKINKEVRKAIQPSARKGIVKILDGFAEKKECFLICELMKGNLNDKSIELMDIQRILEDVGRVLKNMHQKGFVHFDISPGNFN